MLEKNQKKQKGFTLIEMAAVLIIAGIIMTTVYQIQKQDIESQKVDIAAGQLKSVSKAANAYIRDNYSAIMALATDTQPVIIRVSDMVSQNYLQPGTSTLNSYQQAMCALVLQPTPGQLTGLVVTQGGQELDDFSLSRMVSRVGASAGGIYTDTPAAIIGSRGGWSVSYTNYNNPNHLGQDCAGNAGTVDMDVGHAHVALWFENNDLTAGFLYREAIPARPELNRMATNLDMDGNDLTGASKIEATSSFDMNGTTVIDGSRNLVNIDSISASGTISTNGSVRPGVATKDTACSSTGDIRRDSSGMLLSCQSGSWQSPDSFDLEQLNSGNLLFAGRATEDINNNTWRTITWGSYGTDLLYIGSRPATITYKWSTNSCDPSGSVYFRIYKNGTLLYTSPQIHNNGQFAAYNISLNQGDTITGTWYAGTNSCRPHEWGGNNGMFVNNAAVAALYFK